MLKKSQTNLHNNTQRQQNSSSLIKTSKGFDKLNLKGMYRREMFSSRFIAVSFLFLFHSFPGFFTIFLLSY